MTPADLPHIWEGFFVESEAPCFVLAVEPGPRFVLLAVNAGYERSTGLAATMVVGREPVQFLPPELARIADERLRGCLATGEPVTYEEEITFPSGKRVWRTRIVPWPKDQPRFLLGLADDLTMAKRAEQAMREQRAFEQTMVETQKLESLGLLAGGIAHDFNNLLTGILGLASLTRATPGGGPDAEGNLALIESAAMQAADLCRQLLAYSGKGRFSVRAVDLSAVVRESSALFQVSVGKSARLKLELAAGLPAIAGDVTQLRQVLMNLVINASEALGDAAGNITIVTKALDADRDYLSSTFLAPELPEGRYVSLEVRDTGAGMSPETRARIFDPFFTTKFTGRGLGLSAVLGIVRGHRGAIKVYSEAGKGTIFKLLFPAIHDVAEPLPEAEKPVAAPRACGTALVIDDEHVVREVTSRMLKTLGYEVLQAGDGERGLQQLRAAGDVVCVVLLDLTMPGLSGEEVFRQIHQLRPHVPVVLMSGYNEQEAVGRFTSRGLAGFLQKPFTFAELARKLPREP